MTNPTERPEERDSLAPWEHRPDCYGPTGFWSDKGCKHATEPEWLRSRLAEKNARISQMEEALRDALSWLENVTVRDEERPGLNNAIANVRAALSPSDTEPELCRIVSQSYGPCILPRSHGGLHSWRDLRPSDTEEGAGGPERPSPQAP